MIGNQLSRYFLDRNYVVHGIDDLSGGYRDFLPQHKNFLFTKDRLEILSKNEKFFSRIKPVAVIHCAAYAAEGLSPFIRKFNYQSNLIESMNVLNFCIKNETKLIFTSSMAVYGGNSPPFSESTLTNPVDPYGIAKLAVELDIKQANQQFGLQYNIIRPHNVLGKYQNIWDKYRNVAGIFIRNAIYGDAITIYGDGSQLRAFSDIKFMLPVFEKLISGYSNEVYNLGSDKVITILELAKIVSKTAQQFNIDVKIQHLEPRHEVKEAYCDHSKAKDQLNFYDNTSVEDVILTMMEWAIKQPKRKVKKIDYELSEQIYSYWVQ